MMTLTLDQAQDLSMLKPVDVVAVYSGKPGCACGCRGKYAYNPEHRARASKHRGYKVDDDEVSLYQVRRVLALLQANAERVEFVNDGIFAFDLHEGRTYTVYTLESHK